jgi:hypothetical protein
MSLLQQQQFDYALWDIDQFVERYYTEKWVDSLPFRNCYVCNKNEPYTTALKANLAYTIDDADSSDDEFPNDNGQTQNEKLDIFSYCAGGLNSLEYGNTHVIRFDPTKFPVPTNLDLAFAKGSVGAMLITKLLRKVRKIGQSDFVSNGSYSKRNRVICCYRHRSYNRECNTSNQAPFRDVTFRKKMLVLIFLMKTIVVTKRRT